LRLSPFSHAQLSQSVFCDSEQNSRWAISHDNSDVAFLLRETRFGVGLVEHVFRREYWEGRPFGLVDLFVEMTWLPTIASNFLTVFEDCSRFKMFPKSRGWAVVTLAARQTSRGKDHVFSACPMISRYLGN
jgi:hypothetical protein